MADIDINREQLLSLGEASRQFPPVNGRHPSPNTLWRWCRRGVHGVTLQYVRIGRRICTTPAACSRFANALAEADEPLPKTDPERSVVNRRAAHERAEAELAAEGI